MRFPIFSSMIYKHQQTIGSIQHCRCIEFDVQAHCYKININKLEDIFVLVLWLLHDDMSWFRTKTWYRGTSQNLNSRWIWVNVWSLYLLSRICLYCWTCAWYRKRKSVRTSTRCYVKFAENLVSFSQVRKNLLNIVELSITEPNVISWDNWYGYQVNYKGSLIVWFFH